MTFVVQQGAGAVAAVEDVPLGARVGNALISYGRYLGKLFWPTELAVFYPRPGHWPLGKVLLAGGLIAGPFGAGLGAAAAAPYLLVGWLWFLGTLVPVIGLVQVGEQAMADRYTYLPSLGVLVLAVWGAYELTRRWQYQVLALAVAGGAALVLCLALTRQQIGYWKDSEALFRHALAVTENNGVAHNGLGMALDQKGQINEAIRQYQEALRLRPVSASPTTTSASPSTRKAKLTRPSANSRKPSASDRMSPTSTTAWASPSTSKAAPTRRSANSRKPSA